MLEELKQIETKTLDDLAELQKEHAVLDDRLAKLDERRNSVSPEVWAKVSGDYQKRISELDQAASPLKQEARSQYATLGQLYQKIQEALTNAELKKEEVELRHELGEFAKKDFQKQIEESEGVVLAHRQEIEAADTLKKRFTDVFGSEENLAFSGEMDISLSDEAAEEEAAAEEKEAAEPSEEAADEATEEENKVEKAADPLPETQAVEESPTPSEDSDSMEEDIEEQQGGDWDDDDPTVDAPLPELPSPEEIEKTSNLDTLEDEPVDDTVEESAFTPPPAPGPVDGGVDSTVILSRPRLVAMENGLAVEEYILSVDTTSMGRAPENSVCLNHDSISRQHAAIVPTPEGYMICDLHSENGTYVNDEKIHERHLSEGDVVRLGATIFIYRS